MPLKIVSALLWLGLSSCALTRTFPPLGNCEWLDVTGQWQCVDALGNKAPTPSLKSLIAFPEDDWVSYDKVCHQ